MPCWLKFGRAIECTDMEMCFGWQPRALAGQCRPAPGTKSPPGSARRRVELSYPTLSDRIRRAFECHKNRSRCAAMLTTTLAMAPIYSLRLTGCSKTDSTAQAATFELVSRAGHHPILHLGPRPVNTPACPSFVPRFLQVINPAPVPVDGGVDRFVNGGDQERREALAARVAGMALLKAPARRRLAIADLESSLHLGPVASSSFGVLTDAAVACGSRALSLYAGACDFINQKALQYADFSKVETLGRIPLPVRCQPRFWRAEFGCRLVRPKTFKKLISHGFSILAGQFSGTETRFSAVVSGIAGGPSARLSGEARA